MCLILEDCSQDKLENYNSLLQKKVVDLENKLLSQTLFKQNSTHNIVSLICTLYIFIILTIY